MLRDEGAPATTPHLDSGRGSRTWKRASSCWSNVIDPCVICRAMASKHLGVHMSVTAFMGKMSAVRTIQSPGDAGFACPSRLI
jgi:hypothetical protein